MIAWAPLRAVAALAGLLLALGLNQGIGAAPASQAADAPVSPAPVSGADPTTLSSALQAAEALWQSLGELRERLLGNAERALEQADQAASLDERQRQEALYHQLSDRLADLDQARAELKIQLELLRRQLDTLPTPE